MNIENIKLWLKKYLQMNQNLALDNTKNWYSVEEIKLNCNKLDLFWSFSIFVLVFLRLIILLKLD